MIYRNNYTYDQINDDVLVSNGPTYPDRAAIAAAFAGGRDIDTIKRTYMKVLDGEFNTPLIMIEQRWYELTTIIKEETGSTNPPLRVTPVSNEDNSEDSPVEEEVEEISAEVKTALTERNYLEKRNPWLVEYRTVNTNAGILDEMGATSTRPKFTRTALTKAESNHLIAQERDRTLGTLDDSVADNNKTVQLLTRMVMEIYKVLDDDTKDKMDPVVRGNIDAVATIYDFSKTWTCTLLESDGLDFVKRLNMREGQMQTLIKKIKEIK